MNDDRTCTGCVLTTRRDFLEHVAAAWALTTVAGPGTAMAGGLGEIAADTATQSSLTYPVPAADGASIDKKEQIILVRFQGKVFAFPLACPHENTALRWRARDLRFQCERHGSRYSPDGTFREGRATRNMDRYAVSKNGTSVVVDLTKLYQSDTQGAQWAAASVAV